MEGQTYKRTVSADDSGFQYELKMTALAALRLYNQSDEFYLANNFDAGEKFDDLVFTASMKGQWTTWFIQLKHKQKSSLASRKITLASITQETKANKNDYNLIKYFDSYKAIGRKFHPGSNNVIFGRNYDGARFVIFTNSILSDEIISKEFDKVQLDFLCTNPQGGVNLKFDAKKDLALFKGIQEKALLADFLSKFYMCSNQASEDAVDEILNSEIKLAAPDLSNVEVNYVNGQIKDYIRRWYKTKEYLTKENVKALLLKSSVETQAGKKSEVSIRLQASFLKQVSENLLKEPITIYMSNAANTLLCEAALRQLQILDEPNVYVNLKQLENEDFRSMMLNKWKESKGIILIINLECDVVQINIKDIGDFISKLSKVNKKNFIIMLSTLNNERSQKLAAEVAAKRRNFTCTLVNMHDEAKAGLMESNVLFQGHETPLSSIMPPNKMFDQVLEMSTISDLLRGQLAHVGLKPIEPISYYITRVLIRNCILPKIFETCSFGVIFVLSDIPYDVAKEKLAPYADTIMTSSQAMSATSTVPKIVVLENGHSFDDVAAQVGGVHWLQKHKNLWVWKRSTANVADIVHYNSHILDFTTTDNIMKIQDKVVLVIAEPGMGKSTLLVHMAAETKRLNPHIWVVLVTLNDFTDRMASDDFMRNIKSNVKAIVAEAAGVTSEASKFHARLFDHCFDVTGKMIVLLDGFDEITPYYTKEGLALVNVLQNSKIERVWVTARPIMRDQLQKATNIIPYNIKPFTPKDQQIFLSKFWKKTIPDIKVERLNEFIEKVLSLVGASFEGESDDFYGIPLQTRMLAETFEKELNLFHQTGKLTLPSKINRLQLFEAFVGKKLNILDEKAKVVTTNAVSRNQAQMWRKAQETRLMKLALLTMLNQEQCARLRPPLLPFEIIQLKDEVANGEEKTGIVISYKHEVPQFIHRTFAEYFVARFFETHLKENAEFLTSETYNSSSFNLVKYFLDRLLAKGCDLHEAVFNQNVEELSLLLKSEGQNVNKTDKGGRTALHLAASQSDGEAMIRLLLEAGADTSKVDDVFQWKAMQFAIQLKDVGNIAPLVERQHFAHFPKDILLVEWKTFKKAMEGDYLDLFLGLLENGIVSVLGIDVLPPHPWIDENVIDGMTYLHLAAAFNANKILKYLLRNDTRDSKLWLMERVNCEGDTALLVAAARGHRQAVSLLLAAGANILATTKDSKNIVDLAVERYDTELLSIILSELNKNKQFAAEPFLMGVLTGLAGNKNPWACAALQLFLLSYPQLLNCNTKREMPLIALAVSKGNDVAVKMMCMSGADVNQKVKSKSLLHIAVERGWESTVGLLLESPGIMVDQQDELGQTPLYVAADKGYSQITKLLIGRRANPQCETSDGSNVSHAAARSADPTIISYLLNVGVDFRTQNTNGESGLSILSDAGQDVLVDFLQSVYGTQPFQEVCNVLEPPPPAEIEVLNGTPTIEAAKSKKQKKNKKAAVDVTATPPDYASNGEQQVPQVLQTLAPASYSPAIPSCFKDSAFEKHVSQPVQPPAQPKAKKVKRPKPKKIKPNQQPATQSNAFENSSLLNLIRDISGQLSVDKLTSMLQQSQLTQAQKPPKVKKPKTPGPSNPAQQAGHKQKNKKPANQQKPDGMQPQSGAKKQPIIPKKVSLGELRQGLSNTCLSQPPPPPLNLQGVPAITPKNVSLAELRQGLQFFNPSLPPPPPLLQGAPPFKVDPQSAGKKKGKQPQHPGGAKSQNPQVPVLKGNPGPNNGPPKPKKEGGKPSHGPKPKAHPGQGGG